MTVRTAICVLVMMTAGAFGQGPATIIHNTRTKLESAANAAAQRRNEAMGSPAREAASPVAVAASGAATHRTAGLPRSTRKHAKASEVRRAASGSEPAPEMKKTYTLRGKRDPFVSVIRMQSPKGPACATGKKCLVAGQIELKGVVQSENGMIAVVENPQRQTYFLHEKDPVFNGEVVKIEPDEIVLRETVVDRAGRQSTREVVKRVGGKPAA